MYYNGTYEENGSGGQCIVKKHEENWINLRVFNSKVELLDLMGKFIMEYNET